MLLKSKRGFTLVELIMVVAGLAGVAIVGMQLSKSQNQTMAKGQLDSDILLTTNEINAILSDPAKCLTTLGGKNALSTVTGINAINSNKFFSVESGSAPAGGYGNSKFKIQNYALSASTADVSSNNASLLINYQNKNIIKGNSGPSTITKKVNLYVEVDVSNNITKCRALATSSSDIWIRGTGTTIHYLGGNVGIGTAAPASMLEVKGDLKIGNTTPASTTCTVTQEGSTRYNSTLKAMEFCNGTVWSPIGGGLRIESGQSITANSCTSGSVWPFESGFFCSTGIPSRNITFAKPFTQAPKIIVTQAGPSSNSSLLPCTGGAMDAIYVDFDQVTTTGFRAIAGSSPYGSSCSGYANYYGTILFSWYAIGN